MATSRHATYEHEDLVHLYLVDVARHPLLTKGDEVNLAQRVASWPVRPRFLGNGWRAESNRGTVRGGRSLTQPT